MTSFPARVAAVPQALVANASGRRWEIDALRGLMLVLMTVTHIPTRFSDPLGQPFGYMSAAEGFVLLSAYVAGKVYAQRQLRAGAAAMGSAFLKRALKIYLCQAGLLVFLLSGVALLGVLTHQAAITNLLTFFYAQPLTALFSGLLLIYNPPLLDILPMYILFMLASPLVLLFGLRHGWAGLLIASGLIWLAAQFGLSQAAYDTLVRLFGMPVPFRETGAFEMLAWQFLWVLGLWIGAGEATGQPVQPRPFPRWTVAAALVLVVLHFAWRHAVGQVPFPGHEAANLAYDKWQLGPMRLVNFLGLVLLVMRFGPTLAARLPRWRPLELLGRQSLPVFCAHLVLALLVLAILGASALQRSWLTNALLLSASFGVLYGVAVISERIDRRAAAAGSRFRVRRAERRRRRATARPGTSGRPAWHPRLASWRKPDRASK